MAASHAENNSAKVCVLVSGGLDSAVLLKAGLDENKEVHPLFVSVGFVWEEAEQFWLQRLLEALAHPQLKALTVLKNPLHALFSKHWAFTASGVPDAASRDEAVYLPARNLLLLTEAAVYAQSRLVDEIWLGVLKANPFGDGQPAFFESFEGTCRLGLPRPLKIRAPFRELSKAELVRRYPDFPYALTFSCIQPRGTETCGACNKCEERRASFKALGIHPV